MTVEDLANFHAQQYGPGNLIIAVVGAVKAADVVATVTNHLGDWMNPNQKTDADQPDVPQLGSVVFKAVTLPGKTQSDIVMGVPGPSRLADDYMAAKLANHVLGVFGMFGRLGASVREKQGLAYYSYSNLEGGIDQGAWRVIAGVSPSNVKRAVDSIRVEIQKMLDEPVTEDDIADSKANLTGRLPLQLESNEGVAANLLAMERYNLGLDYLRNYTDMINSITIPELQAAMQKYWRADAFALAVAGPELDDAVV
jgi:zinc protease